MKAFCQTPNSCARKPPWAWLDAAPCAERLVACVQRMVIVSRRARRNSVVTPSVILNVVSTLTASVTMNRRRAMTSVCDNTIDKSVGLRMPQARAGVLLWIPARTSAPTYQFVLGVRRVRKKRTSQQANSTRAPFPP